MKNKKFNMISGSATLPVLEADGVGRNYELKPFSLIKNTWLFDICKKEGISRDQVTAAIMKKSLIVWDKRGMAIEPPSSHLGKAFLEDLYTTKDYSFDKAYAEYFLRNTIPDHKGGWDNQNGQHEDSQTKNISSPTPLEKITIPVKDGTKWEQIKIRIINDQRIEIAHPGGMSPWTRKDIGFEKAHMRWKLIELFAEHEGAITSQNLKTVPKSLKANISKLRNHLCALFPAISKHDDKPIKDFYWKTGYVCKFQISKISPTYLAEDEINEQNNQELIEAIRNER